MENIESEKLENICFQANEALTENCIGVVENQHSQMTLQSVAHMLSNMMNDDYTKNSGLAVMVYSKRQKHYASDESNSLALLAIREICKTQLLQKQQIDVAEFNDVFEILDRIDEHNEGTIIDL